MCWETFLNPNYLKKLCLIIAKKLIVLEKDYTKKEFTYIDDYTQDFDDSRDITLYKENLKKYHNNRRMSDVQYRLQKSLRSRLYSAIKGNKKTGSAVHDLGCTVTKLKVYLESKFTEGMNWANWSFYGWHIDHIKPLSSFDLDDIEQLKQACHYTNLQPLWGLENMRKGAKYQP